MLHRSNQKEYCECGVVHVTSMPKVTLICMFCGRPRVLFADAEGYQPEPQTRRGRERALLRAAQQRAEW